jgi:two-component system, cell cycle sensor histidine kinase and response regulator CckA
MIKCSRVSTLILVVDDERDILEMVEAFLRTRGYEVIAVSDGEDAVRIFQDLPKRPDVVLTDVVMPGISGPMLADRLLSVDPGVRIVFMSGYDDRQVVRRYVVERGYQLVAKPFDLKALQKVIESAVNA